MKTHTSDGFRAGQRAERRKLAIVLLSIWTTVFAGLAVLATFEWPAIG